MKMLRPGIQVTTKKRIRGLFNSTKVRRPLVIDTSKPPVNNTYLGAPHHKFGGPGMGRGGYQGWNQNKEPQGMAITYSGAISASIARYVSGAFIFDFDTPTTINSIGILNNMYRVTVVARNVEGGLTEIVHKGAHGSFLDLQVWQPAVVKLVVKGNGVFAITHLGHGECPEHYERGAEDGSSIHEEDERLDELDEEDPPVEKDDENHHEHLEDDPMDDADFV